MPLAIVALDLALYVQHATFHFTPALWRLHRLHHADTVFDVSTGLRFHPFELALSAAFKMVVVLALGAPPLAVLGFEILPNATSTGGDARHAPGASLDGAARAGFKLGFNLPWWDWLFATYRAGPAAGLDAMTIGLPAFRAAGEQRFDRMLMQPWRVR